MKVREGRLWRACSSASQREAASRSGERGPLHELARAALRLGVGVRVDVERHGRVRVAEDRRDGLDVRAGGLELGEHQLTPPLEDLYQSGYLTIRGHDPRFGEYQLVVPNGEVEWGLVESLLPAWAPGYSESRGTDVFTLRRLVEAGDTEGMRRVIAALFASIPYTREDDPFENYFQAVLWLVFALLGRYVHTEVRTARGHCWPARPRHAAVAAPERGIGLPHATTLQFVYKAATNIQRDGTRDPCARISI